MQVIKLNAIDFDKVTIPQNRLDISYKTRSNLLPWKGQFSPELIQALLETYSKKDDIILDPFMGSGTVLHEAVLMNLSAIGVELNPAAVQMAQIYLLSRTAPNKRQKIFLDIEKTIFPFLWDELPLFKSFSKNSYDLFHNIKQIRDQTQQTKTRLILETYLMLMDPKKDPLTKKKAQATWEKLKLLTTGLPWTKSQLKIIQGDCRKIPLKTHTVDLVLTSPPYINVFNYHQQKRLVTEAMGWDILSIAKSEIGSNRKYRSNRFFTVIQYCLDMAMVLYELGRVCKPKAKMIFIIGRESQVKKTSFFNSEIIANIASQVFRYNMECRHERLFKNRYGQIIKEDILLFENPISPIKYHLDPRQIAHHILIEAKRRVPKAEKASLDHAIKSIETIKPSPIYQEKKLLESILY